MKQLVLTLAAAALTTAAAAQCTPDPLYADSVFGVWPDTLENFKPGMVNVFYSDTLNLIIPTDANSLDPNIPVGTATLDSVQLLNIVGLPPGLVKNCNSQTSAPCTYLGGVLGCGLIEGTPTQEGTFPLVMEVTVFATTILGTIPFDTAFYGYKIVVGPNTVDIAENSLGLSGVRNMPNPFTERTTIAYQLGEASMVNIRVFNLVGAELRSTRVAGKPGSNRYVFNASGLEDGIYLYKVEAGKHSFTGRMVVYR